MKSIYWRPRKVTRGTILGISLFAVVGLVLVESLRTARPMPHREEKIAAATLAEQMMQAIKEERLRIGHRIYPRLDPMQTGMVGRTSSPVTTLPAKLAAKQASVNPNFAAAVVEMLIEIDAQPGDVVAVGYSGSFPALNVAVCAALESFQLEPIVVASAASSSFGANNPDLMWLDMERLLRDHQLISFGAEHASLGGTGDRLMGHTKETRELVADSISRNEIGFIDTESLRESIDRRMNIIQSKVAGRPVKAYINVGGGAASIGGSRGKEVFHLGLNCEVGTDVLEVDCVASRLASEGTPVIHLGDADRLAVKLGLSTDLESLPVVHAGMGPMFEQTKPNRIFAGAVLLCLLWLMRANILTDTMHKIRQALGSNRRDLPSIRVLPESREQHAQTPKSGPQLMV